MRKIALVLALLLVATQAWAISRRNIAGMSCDSVQALVQSEGAVLLQYRSKSGLPLYDRYVVDRSYCGPAEVTNRTSVPTTDRKACPVRNCIPFSISDFR